MLFLVLAVLVSSTAVATVWLADTRPRRDNDPDATFWYVFTGLCVATPMILIPAATSTSTSIWLASAAAASALAAHRLVKHRRQLQVARERRARTLAALMDLADTHETLLARWLRYEVDPAAAIDFPGMSDVRTPETSALIRALATAAQLRPSMPAGLDPVRIAQGAKALDDGVSRYRGAVTALADALERAEIAARVHD